MKLREIIRLLCIASLVLFVIPSCVKEGPPGLDGVDGADGADGIDGEDGADGQVTCLICHESSVIDSKKAEFALSGHFVGEVREGREAWSSGCVKCHIPIGFVEYAETGENLGTITNPSDWECSTCHGLHKTFNQNDYALRLSDPVAPIFNNTTTMDLIGNSNLCANCHQSRAAEPNIATPGETFKISTTHYGPHYSAQANVVYGTGLAEIPGSVEYPVVGSNKHLQEKEGQKASCVGCHMYEYSAGEGGHSWWPSVDACNKCHDTELTDFNYGGVRTDIEDKLEELRDKLIALGVVAGDEVEGYHPVVGTYPMIQAQAFFNWKGLEEDRSLGAHNPKYVKALLMNTLEALE
jgi:Zn-finger protein